MDYIQDNKVDKKSTTTRLRAERQHSYSLSTINKPSRLSLSDFDRLEPFFWCLQHINFQDSTPSQFSLYLVVTVWQINLDWLYFSYQCMIGNKIEKNRSNFVSRIIFFTRSNLPVLIKIGSVSGVYTW